MIVLLASFIFAKPIEAHTVSPVNLHAQQTTKAVMNWLAHLQNRTENRVLSGAFGGYSHDPFSMSKAGIRSAAGQSPAIYGCDYARGWLETANIEDSIDVNCNSELLSYWKSGGIPQISMHLANPAIQSGHFKTKLQTISIRTYWTLQQQKGSG
ncbi:exported mannan endo-1,4-beta-mannosidase [Bacillus tequilensis]|nr:exported mannan endo-1,4-beta-mannosidase [Bacillus tequilensis]